MSVATEVAAGAADRPIAATEIVVRVPATSANLGPGFDALGLALDLWDTYTVRREDPPTAGGTGAAGGSGRCTVRVDGEGAGTVAADEANLVVTAMRSAAEQAGVALPPFSLHCANRIPHGRGLGSSAAAIVGGILAGRALAGLTRDAVAELALAAAMEGHPDNVAAALLGGLTVAWCGDPSSPLPGSGEPGTGRVATGRGAHAISLTPVPLRVRVFVPPAAMSTSIARGLLPTHVPHVDAAHAAGRSALLVAALTAPGMSDRPAALLAGTDDRLHQAARGAVLPVTHQLLVRLRAAGVAAVLSGSGPAVLALAPSGDEAAAETGAEAGSLGAEAVPDGWSVLDLAVAPGARCDLLTVAA